MKEFFDRNKPVFIIGLLTVAVFGLIILVSQKKVPNGPILRKIENAQLITPETYTKGSSAPAVQIVEFSDFECIGCKNMHPYVEQLFIKYEPYVSLSFRNFALPQHTKAVPAAVAARAAGEQGKFWEYTASLFRNQPVFEREDLVKYAEELGLNVEKFKKDLENKTLEEQVNFDVSEGARMGLLFTPSFIVNGNLIEMAQPDDLEKIILKELEKAGINPPGDYPDSTEETSQSTQTVSEIPFTGTVTQIEYTSSGFQPNNLKLKLGDKVKFVNTTDREISIRQLIQSYKEFAFNVKIKPGESYELLLYKPNLWTFKEDSTRHYGSIYASE